MAGRIRSIKPELLEDDKTANLSHEGWRCFVSLLLLADDYGNFRAHPALLEGAIFWGCPSSQGIGRLIRELGEVGLITVYSVRDQTYGHINGWARHQRVDKPGKPRCPGPKDAEKVLNYEDSRMLREPFAPDLRPPTSDHRPGPPRGEGETAKPSAPPSKNSKPQIALLPSAQTSEARTPRVDVQAVWDHFISTRTMKGRPPALDAKRAKMIAERLKSYTVDDLKHAAEGHWLREWHITEGFIGPEYVFRDAKAVDSCIEAYERDREERQRANPLPPPPPDTSGPATEASKKLLAEAMAKLNARIDEDNARMAAAIGPAKKY